MALAKPKLRLLYANSEICADLLFASGFMAPDAFACLETPDGVRLLLSDLELDRGRREARVAGVDSLSEWTQRVTTRPARAAPSPPAQGAVLDAWMLHFAPGKKRRTIEVPRDFPHGLAVELQRLGWTLQTRPGLFFPAREIKSASDLRSLRTILRLTQNAMERAWEVLAASQIGPRGILRWGGQTLTSQRLRAEIDTAVLQAGGTPGQTIVAGGNQACDPHERGYGPLRAHQLIILDIFPRDPRTGFYGDLTRTVVRGRADEAQRRLWQTALEGQRLALAAMRPGVSGASVHRQVVEFFAQQGYPTERKNNRWQGFFHGTGHGLGLELHEPPRFAATTFQPGQVLTVEPGLYFPGLGGVRHEDVVVVTESGKKLLTTLAKPLEI
jgi:Xaa-Pro aminopeptidase